MKNAAALLLALPLTLAAQNTGTAFQYVVTSDAVKTVVGTAIEGKPVTGRPLTASEERHTLQVLGDGTRIESKSTDKLYRDDQGRTRTEREDGTVVINDVVSGASAEISKNRTMVRRKDVAHTIKGSVDAQKLVAEAKANLVPGTTTISVLSSSSVADKLKAEAATLRADETTTENLGIQTINGVLAEGTRTTRTIAAGAIGNDRPIQIVNERWYSTDLQMLVRSSNKDPRFGETTYDLVNILQGQPDSALFQIPNQK
jgi:hypothetical protein